MLVPYTLDSNHKLNLYAQLFAGAVSGIAAQTSSYPMEIIRRHMQIGGLVRNEETRNTVSTAKYLYRIYGLRGFFVGLGIGYIKVAPMFAVSFLVYEWMKKRMDIE